MNNTVRRTSCRLCESGALNFEVELPRAPIADHYATVPNAMAVGLPQDLYQCEVCGHVQLLDIVPRELLFSADYAYRPSRNPAVVSHFSEYVEYVRRYLPTGEPCSALDIGSNDGLFLEVLREKLGATIMGVDPARAVAEEAVRRGVPTVVGYWDHKTAIDMKNRGHLFDLVSANNVFAHNDNLREFAAAIPVVMKDQAIFASEISYLDDIIRKTLLGTFFHEHLSHHSLLSLQRFLIGVGLHLFDARPVDTQGGALIVLAAREPRDVTPQLNDLLRQEEVNDLTGRRSMAVLRQNLARLRRDVAGLIESKPYNRLVLFGASRSLNLFLDFFDLRRRVDMVVDSDSAKIGKYIHGTSTAISSQEGYTPEAGDLIFCSAWVHTNKIRERVAGAGCDADFLSIFPAVARESIKRGNYRL